MKEDRVAYIVIAVIWLVISLIVSRIYESITEEEKTYEYALNCEIGVSSNCYLKDDIGYCEIDNKRIRVDNYYLKED